MGNTKSQKNLISTPPRSVLTPIRVNSVGSVAKTTRNSLTNRNTGTSSVYASSTASLANQGNNGSYTKPKVPTLPKTDPSTIILSEPGTNTSYIDTLQNFPVLTNNTDVFITQQNITQKVTNVVSGGVTSITAGIGISVDQSTGDVTISATGGGGGSSGYSGISGYSGVNGTNGTAGASGYSGQDGTAGSSGYSGASGQSGYSGVGYSGFSGFSGQNGAAASSGFSGYSGVGTSGNSGYSGLSGFSGTPSGSTAEIQFNSGGAFSSSSSLTFTTATSLLTTPAINLKNTYEVYSSLSGATGTVTHDFANGSIFNHTSIAANFTANFTNLNLTTGNATSATLILNQGATAYIPNAVQISGVGQTIKWQGGSAPSGNANNIDIVNFSIINASGTYTVFGQLVTFA